MRNTILKKTNITAFIICLIFGSTFCFADIIEKTIPASLDTPEILSEIEKAAEIAGDDRSLLITKHAQLKEITPLHPPFDKEAKAEPTQLFDNLYFVGDANVGVFILTTNKGYIMVDSGYDYMVEETILPGMIKLGLDPSNVKYILVTHAGPDHVGGLKYFQDNYGSRIVMSEEEWAAVDKGRAFTKAKRDITAIDGNKLTLGDSSITMVSTKRKVDGGGFSYIAQVFDNGEPHMWATYGNTNVVGELEDKKVYRNAVEKFMTYVDAYKVDVVISNHPFVDGSTEFMEALKYRKPGEPNPFVQTPERARKFFELLDQSAVVMILRQEAGLDETGTMPASEAEKKPWD